MKTNYLLIIAIILLLFNKKDDGIKDLLSSVPAEDALSLLKLLGVDENLVNGAFSLLPDIISGNTDAKSLIKKLLPLILSLANNGGNTQQNTAYEKTYDGTAPVDDFIPDDIKRDLNDYFA